MDELYVHNLLKKFVTNTLSADEDAALKALLLDAENDPAIYKFMDNVWDKISPNVPFSDARAEAVYNNIYADPRFLAAANPEISAKSNRPWLAIAASVAFICLTGLIVGKLYFAKHTNQTAYLDFKTALAQRVKITLPDGTQVWLNAGSHIRFAKEFMPTLREVYLEGEGFFDVVHDRAKPFIIHTHNLNIQVLGTAFDINAYRKDVTAVTVARGKVGVEAQHKLLGYLTPNQQLAYHASTKVTDRRDVNALLYTSWTDGELTLDNVTMAEAADIISRWYGVQFVFKHASLKSPRFVASFPKNTTLSKVMGVLSKLNHFDYTIVHQKVYITLLQNK